MGNHTFEMKREFNDKALNTMLAFLNSEGGALKIGLNDDGSVYGVEGNVDEVCRGIISRFRDLVTPDATAYLQVDVERKNGKPVINIHVEKGTQIPYCLKKFGLTPNGVWTRVGSNTVKASREHIKQMIHENSKGHFLTELSIEQNLTFDYASGVFENKEIEFTIKQKMSLGLVRDDGRYTNLALILSDQCPYSTKVAIFEGLDKSIFKDRKEFTGSLFKQIDDTLAYLNVYNKIYSTFEGPYRVDNSDYPEIALREAYVNALIHRDYYLKGSVLVSLFDNRLEIVSLGGLMPGVTKELMELGVSIARNEKLAQIFYRLEIIEAYGTGIPRILGAYKQEIVKPEIPTLESGFVIELPNRNAKFVQVEQLTGNEKLIYEAFKDKAFDRREATELLDLSLSGTYKLLLKMEEEGIISKIKSGRKLIYTVN